MGLYKRTTLFDIALCTGFNLTVFVDLQAILIDSSDPIATKPYFTKSISNVTKTMSTIWKKLNIGIPKFKCLNAPKPPQLPSNEDQIIYQPPVAAITINYFKSHTDDFSPSFDERSSQTTKFTTSDFANIFASQRFFFSSPGLSNSIFDYTSSNSSSESDHTVIDGGIPFSKHSSDPYTDFRQSMQEMVESQYQTIDVKDNWDYLHELLLCYLALNPKHAHKYIISAFADLTAVLASEKGSTDVCIV